MLANSIVSSRLLGRITTAYGAEHREIPAGFKWIMRVHDIIHGYEEAIGFCTNPAAVRNKDGMSAGILLASVVMRLAASDYSLPDELDRLYVLHRVFLAAPATVRAKDLSIIGRTMGKVRHEPLTSLADVPVIGSLDLGEGIKDPPPTDVIVWHIWAGSRVVIRPSGIELKVKCYLEVCEPAENGLDSTRKIAVPRLGAFKADASAALRLQRPGSSLR